MLCLGVVWIVVGLVITKPDGTLRCRHCRYVVSGINVRGTCPECGASLGPVAAIYAEERRSPNRQMVGVGAAAALIGMALLAICYL